MSRRVQVLFLIALLGVLTCVGLGIFMVAGTLVALLYTVVAVALVLMGAARARAAAEAARRAAGRTCSCCTTSQHDPVKVI